MEKTKLYKLVNSNFAVFLILTAVSCILSISIKNENVFDLMNYHYYNAFAFVDGRFMYDFFPGYANTHLNPLMELPLYFYIQKLNNFPNLVYALQGLWFGFSLFMLYKIAALFFDLKTTTNIWYVVFVLFLATTRQAIWVQIGSSTNEIIMLFLGLWGLYLIFKMLKFPDRQNVLGFVCAGLIMGIGLGLKQTSAAVCLSSGLMLIICAGYLKSPYKSILCFALGGFVGVVISDGWFMFHLWQQYGNPFFPYMNNIFKSEYAEFIPHRDTRNVRDLGVIFPYLWLGRSVLASGIFNDFFFLFGYTFIMIFIIIKLFKRKIIDFYRNNHLEFALLIFLIINYFSWYYVYTCLRYLCVFCALMPLFVVKNIVSFEKTWKNICLSAVFLMTIFNPLYYEGAVHRHNIDKIIDIEKVNLPNNTLIHIYGELISGVLPEFARNNKFRAVAYNKKCLIHGNCGIIGRDSDFFEKSKLAEYRTNIITKHHGVDIYLYNTNYFDLNRVIKDIEYDENISDNSFINGIMSFEQYIKTKIYYSEERMNYNSELMQKLHNKYYCRALRHNLNDRKVPIRICVPKHLKDKILSF